MSVTGSGRVRERVVRSAKQTESPAHRPTNLPRAFLSTRSTQCVAMTQDSHDETFGSTAVVNMPIRTSRQNAPAQFPKAPTPIFSRLESQNLALEHARLAVIADQST